MAIPFDIKTTNFESTAALQEYVEKHLSKLDALVDDEDSAAYAQIELEKIVADQNSGDIYRAEINLRTSGHDYYVDEKANDIYVAIDQLRDTIIREVKERVKKDRTKIRQGARAIKQMLRE